jgi:haloacetate dehalogenase
MCECFRAGYTRDLEHDTQDRQNGRQIQVPCLVLWGSRGVIGRHFDVEAVWRTWASTVRFQQLDCGHFIPEEAPEALSAELIDFLG